jgi:hypothetical protein
MRRISKALALYRRGYYDAKAGQGLGHSVWQRRVRAIALSMLAEKSYDKNRRFRDAAPVGHIKIFPISTADADSLLSRHGFPPRDGSGNMSDHLCLRFSA